MNSELSQKCDGCKRYLDKSLGISLKKCHDCKKFLCPQCSCKCDQCNIILCSEHAKRHRNWACPDCGQSICDTFAEGEPNICIVGGEEICAECYHFCECCNEPVCDDCYHDEYVCESCEESFCEFHPDGIEKKECPSCDQPYCENCADDTFTRCNKCNQEKCEDCIEWCIECGDDYCVDCMSNCNNCNQEICKNCLKKCIGCGNHYCSDCVLEHECSE